MLATIQMGFRNCSPRSQTPATFFVTAQWVQRYPAYAEMPASDRTLGQNSWNHRDLTRLPDDETRLDILRSIASLSR